MTQPAESRLVGALFVLTVTTGLIDAVSYLALGHVFTANMTGNLVFLAFAVAGAPASPSRGRRPPSVHFSPVPWPVAPSRRAAAPDQRGVGRRGSCRGSGAAARCCTGRSDRHAATLLTGYGIIVADGSRHGVRNATVRSLALPDLTTTVLTLTLTGLAAIRRSRRRQSARDPACGIRPDHVPGAAVGALLVRHSLVLPLVASGVLARAARSRSPHHHVRRSRGNACAAFS